jgi:flagellar biosynthesis protein FlhB
MAADQGQRTEKPTQRRLDQARKEGQIPSSKELVGAVQFLGFVVLATTFAGQAFGSAARLTRKLLTAAFRIDVTPPALSRVFRDIVGPEVFPLVVGGLALAGMVVAAQLASTKLGISPSKLAPDIKRLNPAGKLKSIPSQNLPALVQSVLLIVLVSLVLYAELTENLGSLLQLVWLAPQPATERIGSTIATLFWRVAAFFLLVGLVDLLWQRRRHLRQLRMSKQEIREEAKEQEGSPHIKMRIRRLQRELSRRHMMRDVAKATAVIVNPTHYAVAIRYTMEAGSAPRVVAKGQNLMADRIRKKAIEHQVPIVENPPLARALYQSVEVGQEIPDHLYKAVAEILAYIYRLMNGKLPGQ